MALTCALLAGLAIALALSGPSHAGLQGRSGPARGLDGRADRPSASAGVAPLQRPAALHLAAAGGAALGVLLLVPGVLGGAAAAVVGAVVWRRSRHWESSAVRRRRARLEADLPHVVDLMVASLAAGAAPGEALSRVGDVVGGPMADELAEWLTRLRLGADPVSVWGAMAAHPQLGRLGVTLHRSAESGAPVVVALGRLAEELRARNRAEVEARVRQVEVKAAVPLGVCLLPAFVLIGVVPLVAGAVHGFLLAG